MMSLPLDKFHKIARLYFNSCPIFKIFDFIEPQKSDLYVFHRKHFTLLNSSVCNLRSYLGDNFFDVFSRETTYIHTYIHAITNTYQYFFCLSFSNKVSYRVCTVQCMYIHR